MYHIEQKKPDLPHGTMATRVNLHGGSRAFLWQAYREGIKITGYKGNYPEILIPGIIDGKPVTKIGGRAFQDCKIQKRVGI